jgi:curved DNA-binding protein CbpA
MADKQAALQVLGLRSDASDDEIRAAYRRMNAQW